MRMIMKTFEDDNENFDSDEDNTNNSKEKSDNFFYTSRLDCILDGVFHAHKGVKDLRNHQYQDLSGHEGRVFERMLK